MRGTYQCGVLKAFREYDMEFDVVVGSSAGAYNGIRYLAHQMDVCEEIYVIDSSGRKFIKPWNFIIPGRHVLDLDYLVDHVCWIESKIINMDRVLKSRSEFYITALDFDTMVTRFFDAKKSDIHLLLKATAAIPPLYSGKVVIDGRRYIDGGLLEPVPIRKAIELGCAEICVVLNRAAEDRRPSRIKRLIGKVPGRILRVMAEHNRIKAEMDQFLYQPHANLSITVVRPHQPIPVGRFTSDAEKLQSCIDTGYRDGLEFIFSKNKASQLTPVE